MKENNELTYNILFSCKKQKNHTAEQVAPVHVLVYVVSGRVEFQFDTEIFIAQPNDILIIHRNRFVKATKIPDDTSTPYKTINIIITQDIVAEIPFFKKMKFLKNQQERYAGISLVHLTKNRFLHAYFDSLLPYLEQSEKMSGTMAQLKTAEAIASLLEADSTMETFLFDWNEPHKIDLEKFINQNFIFNVPLSEFARVTGRSLSAFKRDFKKKFNTPENWLHNKRLEKAKRLIKHEGEKPSEVYYRVGLENFSRFSIAYKKSSGVMLRKELNL
jgi:AraC-like DNA-binding protein